MPITVSRTSIYGFALIAILGMGYEFQFLSSHALWAQEEATKSESSTDPEALKKLIDRINKLESEVDRLKNKEPAAQPGAEPQVMAMLDVAHLGLFFSGNTQTRFLAFHVMLANSTTEAFTIPLDHVVAEIDGEERLLKDLPTKLLNYSIPSGRQVIQISATKPPKDKSWKLPARGMTGIWLVYPDIPLGANIPKCRLKVKIGGQTKEIDVNELQRAQLALDVQRVGPRQSLALITISGAMNTFNTGALVEELDKLVEQKIARVVIRWGDGATPPDKQLMDWMHVAAAGTGANPNQNPLFPVIPAAIRELHLVEFVASEENQGRHSGPYGLKPTTQPRLHKTTSEAVGAALRTAYMALPRDELLNEIKTGHPLTRASALAFGGGRLDVDQLPLIFELAEDKDPELQKAALQALSHFGEPAAIEKLVLYAQRNVEPLSSSAIESLAGSRFGAAHDALLSLLKNEPPLSKKKIVQVLAKYPRPIWSDTLYEFATNSSVGMDVESLRALVQVGHPQLVDVLERALKSQDKVIRDQAFQELAKRNDERSEVLAVNYSLKLLEAGSPDSSVIQLLTRTKEPRAIPLLLKQLEASHDHANEISLLMQLSDQSVVDGLVQKYSSFNNNEKVQILLGLKLFRHPRFRELCGEALISNDNQMVTTAANALKQEGHAEGEKLLIAALDKQKTAHLLANIMNAIADYGTPSAREALIKARDSGDQNKKRYATDALTNMRQRSPGYQYVFQGASLHQANKLSDANEAYDMAIQLDPNLPEAYLGRGTLLLKLEKFGTARKDFEKVLALKYEIPDKDFAEFVTSISIARIADGQLMEGIKYLEDNRTKSLEGLREVQDKRSRSYFLYNCSCAYARAVEQVDKQPDLTDRAAVREKYRSKAIADLGESFKLGFDDRKWAMKDPDLKILHDDEDFKKVFDLKEGEDKDEKPVREDE